MDRFIDLINKYRLPIKSISEININDSDYNWTFDEFKKDMYKFFKRIGIQTKTEIIEKIPVITILYKIEPLGWEKLKKLWLQNKSPVKPLIELDPYLFEPFKHKSDQQTYLQVYDHLKKVKYKDCYQWYLFFFNYIRKRYIDRLFAHLVAMDELNDCHFNKKTERSCNLISAGTNSIISDYDISMHIPMTSNILSRYYKQVKQDFGQNSTQVFDANLYPLIQFIQIAPEKCLNSHKANNIISHRGKCYKYVSDCDDNNQRMWAFVMIYRDLNQIDNPTFHKSIIKRFKKFDLDGTLIKKAKHKFHELEQVFNKSRNGVKDNISEIREEEYIKYTKELAKPGINKCSTISNGNYYGDEALMTYGAFIFVVVHTQMGIKFSKLKLSTNDLIDCIIENYGYLLTKYAEYVKLKDFLIYGSKYISRIYQALSKYTGINYKEQSYAETIKKKLRLDKHDQTGLEALTNFMRAVENIMFIKKHKHKSLKYYVRLIIEENRLKKAFMTHLLDNILKHNRLAKKGGYDYKYQKYRNKYLELKKKL
jgi:hypothetical protein